MDGSRQTDLALHQEILEAVYRAESEGRFDDAIGILANAIRQQVSPESVAHYLGELTLILLANKQYGQVQEIAAQLTSQTPDMESKSPLLFRNLEASREVAAFLDSGETVAQVPFRDGLLKFEISGQNSEVEHHHVRGKLYEPEEIDLILSHLGDNDTLLDIGANVGNHAIACAASMPGIRVHVFEAMPKCCELLRRNVAHNGLTTIDTSNLGVAIGTEPGRVRVLERINLASSRISGNDIGVPVPVQSLRNLWPGKVDFIKIDIEGDELQVLGSVMDLIERDGTRVLLESYKATVEQDLREISELGLAVIDKIERQAVFNVLVAPRPA